MELEDGLEGIIPISEMSEVRIAKPEDVLEIGQEVEARVKQLQPNQRRISLSLRAATAERERRETRTAVREVNERAYSSGPSGGGGGGGGGGGEDSGGGTKLGDLFADQFRQARERGKEREATKRLSARDRQQREAEEEDWDGTDADVDVEDVDVDDVVADDVVADDVTADAPAASADAVNGEDNE
jgi:hypothetical protein